MCHGTHDNIIPVAIAGCYVVMAPMILEKLFTIACGIMVLLAKVSVASEEKRSTEQLRHAPLEHAQLVSNDTTLATTVSGAYPYHGTKLLLISVYRVVYHGTSVYTRTCIVACAHTHTQ